jgi:hypothetical protein
MLIIQFKNKNLNKNMEVVSRHSVAIMARESNGYNF